jgi:CheY-like chemotaxis protein
MRNQHVPPTRERGSDVSILVADDFEDGLDLYQEYLTYRGYRVIVARNGEEAIAQAHAHRPDLILMDIRMPVMTGSSAARVLRSDPSFGSVPIIALTAHALEGERVAALAAGFDELIAKPCLPDQLVVAIERILAAARQAPEKMAVELFWSKRGVVACATHAPAPASENWDVQGWKQVPAWRQSVNTTILQCQFCHGRPYAHAREEKLG